MQSPRTFIPGIRNFYFRDIPGIFYPRDRDFSGLSLEMMKKFIFRLSPEITRLLHALSDPNLPRYEFLSNKTTFWNRLGVWEARVLSDRSIIDFCHENMARLVWFQITPEISSISKRQNGCSSNLIKTYYFIKMLLEMSAYIIFLTIIV